MPATLRQLNMGMPILLNIGFSTPSCALHAFPILSDLSGHLLSDEMVQIKTVTCHCLSVAAQISSERKDPWEETYNLSGDVRILVHRPVRFHKMWVH